MSEIDDKKRYWLWGELDAVSHEMLKKIQLSVNKKLEGPTFDLHLTLSGPFYDISQDRLNRIESFFIIYSNILNTLLKVRLFFFIGGDQPPPPRRRASLC